MSDERSVYKLRFDWPRRSITRTGITAAENARGGGATAPPPLLRALTRVPAGTHRRVRLAMRAKLVDGLCCALTSVFDARPLAGWDTARVEIPTTDYHTAGEPFRIVTERAVDDPGATVAERRELAAALRGGRPPVRRLLCHEPRGHADMYGGFLVPPDDDGADFGVLFWHKDGFSTACGHGTIALGAWAVESGPGPGAAATARSTSSIDVPSGRVVGARTHARRARSSASTSSTCRRYLVARVVPTPRGAGGRRGLGGAIYAQRRRRRALGLRVVPERPDRAHRDRPRGQVARSTATDAARHPTDDRLSRHLRHDPLRATSARSTSATSRSSPTARSTAPRAARARRPARDARRRRRARRRRDPGATTRSSAPVPRRVLVGRDRRTACSPRSTAPRTARASTASCSIRATRSAPASCCADVACSRNACLRDRRDGRP